jgi:hypothetical protein
MKETDEGKRKEVIVTDLTDEERQERIEVMVTGEAQDKGELTVAVNLTEEGRVQEIRKLHGEIAESLQMTVAKAIRIGELLAEQKAKLDHGEWTPWIEANLPFSYRSARRYITFFENRDQICHGGRFHEIDGAIKLLNARDPDLTMMDFAVTAGQRKFFEETLKKAGTMCNSDKPSHCFEMIMVEFNGLYPEIDKGTILSDQLRSKKIGELLKRVESMYGIEVGEFRDGVRPVDPEDVCAMYGRVADAAEADDS